MGSIIEFHAGDAKIIVAMLKAGTLGEKGTVDFADLSLHLSPDDFDRLSEEICTLIRRPLLLLSDCEELLTEDQDVSAVQISRAWIQNVALLRDDQVEELSQRWCSRISDDAGYPVEPTAENLHALRALIRVCRVAVDGPHELVLTWVV
jgi:hypothetical protein